MQKNLKKDLQKVGNKLQLKQKAVSNVFFFLRAETDFGIRLSRLN